MKKIVKIFGIIIFIFVLYFLSLGPIYGLAARGYIKATPGNDTWSKWQSFHEPLVFAADACPKFAHFMYGYIRLWDPPNKCE